MKDLVAAFREGTDPSLQRELLQRAIESSGPTKAGWITDAQQFIKSLTAGNYVVGRIECYRGGCRTTVHFADRSVFNEIHQAMFGSDGRGWRGQIVTSAPYTRPDGSVDIEWLVLQPDEGEGI